MSYININEVDRTIQDLAPITSDNIVYVPVNTTDGPSGVYTVLQSYDDFVRMYGQDPNPNSAVMTSWEYAANLLLRKMPVMVRRITNFVDDEGNDKFNDFLPNTSNASAVVAIPAAESSGSVSGGTVSILGTKTLETGKSQTTALFGLFNDDKGNSTVIRTSKTTEHDADTELSVSSYNPAWRSTVYTVAIKNNTADNVILDNLTLGAISKLEATAAPETTDSYTFKSMEISKTTTEEIATATANVNALFELRDKNGNRKTLELTKTPDNSNMLAVVLSSGDELVSKKSYKNPSVYIKDNDGTTGMNVDASFYMDSNIYITQDVEATEDSNKVSILLVNKSGVSTQDTIKVLNASYRYAGTNGSRISVSLKTVAGDGIYLQIWNGSQRLENIQLVNLRYKMAGTNRFASYDLYKDIDTIWNLFLANFSITSEGTVTQSTPLSTNYVDVSLDADLAIGEGGKVLKAIYLQRGDVKTKLTGGSNPSDDDVIHEVYKTYAPLKDKYLYDIKFVSDGGYVDEIIYPSDITRTPEVKHRYIEDAMLDLAESRGECLAFLDVPMGIDKNDVLDYYSYLSTSYGTAYAPWTQLSLLTRTTKWCPPSFVALWTIARSVGRGNKIYAPPAGVNRALIPECQDLAFQIPADYIDSWQDNYTQFINPILYINGYGVSIFGQKTLYSRVDGSYDRKSALQYLNTRLVANEVKKRIFKTCIELTFEYNNLHTWLSFKTKMSKLLDVMLYNHSITYYDIVMDERTMTDADIQANHVVGTVSIAVSTTAEKFDITFELLPNQVNFLDIDYSIDNTTDSYGTQA